MQFLKFSNDLEVEMKFISGKLQFELIKVIGKSLKWLRLQIITKVVFSVNED